MRTQLPVTIPPLAKLGPLVSVLALTILLGAALLQMADAAQRAPSTVLGAGGLTFEVTATVTSTPSDRLARDLRAVVDRHGVALAFTPDNSADILTLLDPLGRFSVAGPAVAAELAAGDGRRAAAVSTTVAPVGRTLLLPDEVELIGQFTPVVAFRGVYPTVLLDVESGPLGTGHYLVAGVEPGGLGPVLDVFDQNGMAVQNIAVNEPPGLHNQLGGVYGTVVLALTGIVTAAALLVSLIHASYRRPRLWAAAALGATRSDLRGLIVGSLLPQVLWGTGIGIGLCTIAALIGAPLLYLTPGAGALALLMAAGAAVMVWSLIVLAVTAREMRRCRRAVAC